MSTFFKFFILALCLTIVSCSNKKSTDPSQDHVPAAPSNLIGEVLSSSSIRLTWADNSSNETRFLIFRSNTGIWSQIATTPQNHTTFTDTNLLEVTSYQYYVVATNNAGNSTASDILSLTTELAAPSNLTGQVISSSSIRLTWVDNSNFETGFRIFRSTTDLWSQVGTVGVNQIVFSDTNLTEFTTYKYYVVAADSNSISAPSDTTSLETFGISLIGSQDTPGSALDVFVQGSYAYVADNQSGLQVINVIDPTNPVISGTYDTPGNAWGIFIQGDYAYVADQASGLQIIDISNPSNPIYAGSYDTLDDAYGVFLQDNYAYVASAYSGLQIINIANPANPVFVGRYYTAGFARNVFVMGNYAYVPDYSSGLLVVNISNPANPLYSGIYHTTDIPQDIFVLGDYAYLAVRQSGIDIINVSNPTNPFNVARYYMLGWAFGVYVIDNYAYVAAYTGGLQVIDITQPTNPIYAGSYNTSGSAHGVHVFGDYIYVSCGDSGLMIFRFVH